MHLRWAHEGSILQTVVLEHPLVLVGDAESLQASLVLELKTGLSCAILHQAEHLHRQHRITHNAAIPADGLIGELAAAHFTLVLDLDELDISNEAQHLDNVPHDLVRRNRLDQLYLILRLEIAHLVPYLPNHLEVVAAEHELHIDIDRV